MTGKGAYIGVLIGLGITTLATIDSLSSSTWITYDISNPDLHVYDHIGLFSRCAPSGCVPFPSIKFCSSLPPHSQPHSVISSLPYACHHPHAIQSRAAPRHHPSTFCSKWRSAGFLLNLSVILSLVALVATMLIMLSSGNGSRKRHGWKILVGLMGLAGLVEIGAVGIVAEVKDYEQMFQVPGYELGRAWWIGLESGLMAVLMALGVGMVQMMGKSDGEEANRQLVGVDNGRVV
ncbi:hypothetical protein QBC36DRAFT_299818 [Triangularia setosa]|uniref:Uncharacterized protein n=1 Tax=Triangularia setosa TaxID=2587417 RepID=A0AAN6W9X4_9PEZI|nr:hypothetical protein QBC36DRAFT_299818 [Podospora setosa]